MSTIFLVVALGELDETPFNYNVGAFSTRHHAQVYINSAPRMPRVHRYVIQKFVVNCKLEEIDV